MCCCFFLSFICLRSFGVLSFTTRYSCCCAFEQCTKYRGIAVWVCENKNIFKKNTARRFFFLDSLNSFVIASEWLDSMPTQCVPSRKQNHRDSKKEKEREMDREGEMNIEREIHSNQSKIKRQKH